MQKEYLSRFCKPQNSPKKCSNKKRNKKYLKEKLNQLKPFIENNGAEQVGKRVKNAKVPNDLKIILHNKDYPVTHDTRLFCLTSIATELIL